MTPSVSQQQYRSIWGFEDYFLFKDVVPKSHATANCQFVCPFAMPALAPLPHAVLSPGPRGAPGHLEGQLPGNPRHHTGHLAASLASAENSQPTCM